MKSYFFKTCFLVLATAFSPYILADNQTDSTSPIHSQADLPFTVELELADFSLPNGLQSYASGMHEGKWIFIGGRTNGLHDFGLSDHNFPKSKQNREIFVVDSKDKQTYSRSLDDPKSGLKQHEIDTLSVTSPQSYQNAGKLYIAGGYGVITKTGKFSTKDTLTAIDMEGLIHWVMHPHSEHMATKYIRQIRHDIFRVTGGYMNQIGNQPTLLIFGQNFSGFYHGELTTGDYTKEIRRFRIKDNGHKLHVDIKTTKPTPPDPHYRRRDLNVVPIMKHENGKTKEAFVAYSGVFTETNGVWTVPVEITPSGTPSMADPYHASTFKQGMNNYASATLGLYSEKTHDMYTTIFGGLSYGYFENGKFETDDDVPFINQISTIKRCKNGKHTQYLMDATFPNIASTQANAGNSLLFGTASFFFPVEEDEVDQYISGVLKLDGLKKERTLVGYIVGGIQSTLPNTYQSTDSAASPYIFKVYVTRK